LREGRRRWCHTLRLLPSRDVCSGERGSEIVAPSLRTVT
jgi:hypothetical protein